MKKKCSIFEKDPNDILDYQTDWTKWLNGADTIADSAWIAPSGITVDSDQFDDTTATVWLSGGTVGVIYSIVNRIMTDGGRQKDRTIRVKIKQQ